MPSPARDRVTVDLRGVGERLRAQAAARHMTAGAFVRRAVVLQLDGAANPTEGPMPAAVGPVVKLTLRVSALSLLIACVFGLIGATAKLSNSRAVRSRAG